MYSKRIWSYWLLMGLFFLAAVSGGCGGSSSSSSSGNGDTDTGDNTVSYESLAGTWTGSNGSGSGQNDKYLPGQRVSVKVESLEYKIRNINYSETSKTGTAELSLKERVTNEQYGVETNRDWGGGFSTFKMTNTGKNSWTFSRAHSDGEDNVTITLQSERSGKIRNVGSMWNEDDPSDKTVFDFTCNVTKEGNESNSPNESAERVDWTKFSGTWIPENGTIDIFIPNPASFGMNYDPSADISILIIKSENEDEYIADFRGDTVITFEKTNAEGYTCSRNTYDVSEASCTYDTYADDTRILHGNHANPSGFLISIFKWSDDEIHFVFVDDDNAITSENGELISSSATVSFTCRRLAN